MSELRARLAGVVILALSAGMITWNIWTLEHRDRFAPHVLVVAFVGVFVAPLVVIMGSPTDPRTGKRPMWFTVASSGLAFFGAAMGVLLTVLLQTGMTILP